MGNLTGKQEKVYEYITRFQRDMGYTPSIREICDALGYKSTSTVHGFITRLEKQGLLRRSGENMRRAMVTAKRGGSGTVSVPLVGKIAAGEPILAIENIEDYYSLPAVLCGGGDNVFLLRVQGESMINAGIFDGDIIIVKKTAAAQNRDIVVALLGDEATVKRFFLENNRVRLQPENDTMEPIITDSVTILGKVVGLLRIVE